MTLLIKITDAEGNTLRQVDATPGQTISFQPGEDRVVLPYVHPDAAKIESIGGEVKISLDGQKATVFQNFELYLEDGTSALVFDGQGSIPASSEAVQELEGPVKASGNQSSDRASTVDYSEAALKSGMFLTSEEAADDGGWDGLIDIE
ncbi:MAG: hypothetical protein GY820_07270, partial [Gammaproteobacteria bacterium]|nr:hypothetical protein [Gammaproteobacteria bacterium]